MPPWAFAVFRQRFWNSPQTSFWRGEGTSFLSLQLATDGRFRLGNSSRNFRKRTSRRGLDALRWTRYGSLMATAADARGNSPDPGCQSHDPLGHDRGLSRKKLSRVCLCGIVFSPRCCGLVTGTISPSRAFSLVEPLAQLLAEDLAGLLPLQNGECRTKARAFAGLAFQR